MSAVRLANPKSITISDGDTTYRRQHPPHHPLKNMTGYAYEYLADALDAGAVTEAQLRTAATRTFRLRFQLGLFVSRHDIAAIWVAFFSRRQRYRC